MPSRIWTLIATPHEALKAHLPLRQTPCSRASEADNFIPMEVSWRELRESLLWEVEKSATRIEIEPTPSFEWVFLGVDRQDPSDLDLFKKILKAVGLSVEGDSRWCAEPALQLPKELASQMRQKSSWKLLCFGDYQGEKSLGQEGRILIVAPSLKSLASSPTEKKKLWQKLQACL